MADGRWLMADDVLDDSPAKNKASRLFNKAAVRHPRGESFGLVTRETAPRKSVNDVDGIRWSAHVG